MESIVSNQYDNSLMPGLKKMYYVGSSGMQKYILPQKATMMLNEGRGV